MSYNLNNKIANQYFRGTMLGKVKCSKCNKLIQQPMMATLKIQEHLLTVLSYYKTQHFICESKSGRASCYCSEFCMKKHNHRFTKK